MYHLLFNSMIVTLTVSAIFFGLNKCVYKGEPNSCPAACPPPRGRSERAIFQKQGNIPARGIALMYSNYEGYLNSPVVHALYGPDKDELGYRTIQPFPSHQRLSGRSFLLRRRADSRQTDGCNQDAVRFDKKKVQNTIKVASITNFCSILAISRSLPVAVEAHRMPARAVRLVHSPPSVPGQPSMFQRQRPCLTSHTSAWLIRDYKKVKREEDAPKRYRQDVVLDLLTEDA